MTDDDGAWLVLARLAVTGAPTAAVVAQKNDGWPFWLLIGLQPALTLVAFAVPQGPARRDRKSAQSAAERELEVRSDTRATVNDALNPVLRNLVEVSAERSKPVRDQLVAQAIPFVLNAAFNSIGSERSRACWFELTDESPPTLVPRNSTGRSGSPTTTFTRGTPGGDAAIDIESEPPTRLGSQQATRLQDVHLRLGNHNRYGLRDAHTRRPTGRVTHHRHLDMLDLMGSALAAALAQRG